MEFPPRSGCRSQGTRLCTAGRPMIKRGHARSVAILGFRRSALGVEPIHHRILDFTRIAQNVALVKAQNLRQKLSTPVT